MEFFNNTLTAKLKLMCDNTLTAQSSLVSLEKLGKLNNFEIINKFEIYWMRLDSNAD